MPVLWTRLIARPLIPILIAIALVGWALAVTFKVQIEGLRIWPIHIVGWRDENGALKLDLDKIKNAQAVAAERAAAAKAAEEELSRQNAERTDHELETLRAAARAATDRYRMRTKAPSRPSGHSTAPSEDLGPQGAERASEDAIMVGRGDLDILVENTVRLKAAYDWAKTLNEPSPERKAPQP